MPQVSRQGDRLRVINVAEDVSCSYNQASLDADTQRLLREAQGLRIYPYRIPRYISPSSLFKWRENKQEWAIQYASLNRLPRMEQTAPMAIGAAFDGIAKAFLESKFLDLDEEERRTFYLEKQVETDSLRESVTPAALALFDLYKLYSMPDLMAELVLANGKPRFEESVEATVEGVPMLGKPDIYYERGTTYMVLDLKVNGFYSRKPPSPKKGYLRHQPGRKQHKDVYPMVVDGLTIDASHKLEDISKEWATQVAMYAWILGAPVGSKIIGGIEQLVGGLNDLRVTSYRNYIGEDFQINLLQELQQMYSEILDDLNVDWSIINALTCDPEFARIVR